MNRGNTHFRSRSLDAFQSLLKEIDNASSHEALVPTLDHLMQQTHKLSNTLSGLLGNLVKISADGESALQERLPQAIEEATDSITSLKELMMALQRLRFTHSQGSPEVQ